MINYPPAMSNATGTVGAGISSAMRHTLSNGIVVLIQRNTSSPTVSIHGDMRVGAIDEPAAQTGIAAFTAASLTRGTTHRTFQDIVEQTEERGCSVSAAGGLHATGFSGKTLTEDLPLVIDILADMVCAPTFPAPEIDKLRGMFLMHLREMEQETHVQAHRALRAMLYPATHPYSRPTSGTLETVQAITRDDLCAFHRLYHPKTTSMAIVGDVDPDAVIALLERTWGTWHADAPPHTQHIPLPPPLTTKQRRDVPMDGKVQSDIIWAVHGLHRTNADFYVARVANLILGQLGMGGRLGDNVRDNQGLAYDAHSSFHASLGAGPWIAAAGVNPINVERAIEAILNEIENFCLEGATDQELADAQAFLTGSVVLHLETNAGVAQTLLDIEYYGLGLDYIDHYPTYINRVTQDDIVRVARTYLSTEHYALAVAGPAHA